jgi:ribosomal small subunit protein bTHX
MGKGDRRTRRGKINRASYGKNRKRKTTKQAAAKAKARAKAKAS